MTMQYYVATGTAATTDIWPVWISSATATAASTAYVWSEWSTAVAYERGLDNVLGQMAQLRAHVAQLQPQLQHRVHDTDPIPEETRQRLESAAKERLEASLRATALLLEHLSPEQRADWAIHKHFDVRADSGKVYRLRKGRSGNVRLLDSQGEAVTQFCIHPAEPCPDEDVVLAQKLWLETDEKAFCKTANKTQLVAA